MTIHFVPGEPNPSPHSSSQAVWRGSHVIAYSSGNSLIIYTLGINRAENIQTLTFEHDVGAVAINGRNALIAVAIGAQIAVFALTDEYSSELRWCEKTRLANNASEVRCLLWAEEEDELAVGSVETLSLHHVWPDCGEIRCTLRWQKHQASASDTVAVTADGSRIASYSNRNFDSFVRVWLRVSYGDDSTLFDLAYADHAADTYVVEMQWRCGAAPGAGKDPEDALHMGLLPRTALPPRHNNDALYTFTADQRMHVWATCDFNGHSYLKLWSSHDLAVLSAPGYMCAVVVDNACLDAVPPVGDAQPEGVAGPQTLNSDRFTCPSADLLLVVAKAECRLYAVENEACNLPSTTATRLLCAFATNVCCTPHFSAKILACPPGARLDDYARLQHPISNNSVVRLAGGADVAFLMHDRVKNSVRCVRMRVRAVSGAVSAALLLLQKFQGHAKPTRQLIASSLSHDAKVMLSVLDLPVHNYLWEPMPLSHCMSITKRFRLNVTRNDAAAQGVVDAVILNDVAPPVRNLRHHVLAVVEKSGYLSVWDCDGVTMDDNDVTLVQRLPIERPGGGRRTDDPHALVLHHAGPNMWVVVAIYGAADHGAWRLRADGKRAECEPIASQLFPGHFCDALKVSAVNTFFERDVSVIEPDGRVSMVSVHYRAADNAVTWTCTSNFATSIQNASFLRGASLVHKVAIVDESCQRVSVWDTRYCNLEFEETFSASYGRIRDVDWAFIVRKDSPADALLSVVFDAFVLVYTQLRYDYTNKVPTFAVLKKIDASRYTSTPVAHLVWLDDASLVVACGNQFFVDDKYIQLGDNLHGVVMTDAMDSMVRQLLPATASTVHDITELVTVLKGPLPVYHPQFLIQAVLLGDVDAVEAVLVRLLAQLRAGDVEWDLGIDFAQMAQGLLGGPGVSPPTQNTSSCGRNESLTALTASPAPKAPAGAFFDAFAPHTADLLVDKLAAESLPLLTRHQQATLRTLASVLTKLAPQRRALDDNGFKFLFVFELFQLLKEQQRLSMRDISWAVHSDQKEALYAAVMHAYGALDWAAARSCGLVFWLDTVRLRELVESVAHREFAETRDAFGRVSVLYMAVRKKLLLVRLWKSTSHPERDKVVRFLAHDFTDPRWRSAAEKNAYVLLGKHRYWDAAYFFLLADRVRDCCVTLCGKLGEVDLALAVAKINVDASSDASNAAKSAVIECYMLPQAIARGDRWLTSWVFWELGMRDTATHALLEVPHAVVLRHRASFLPEFQQDMQNTALDTHSLSFLHDDPILAALYEKLREQPLCCCDAPSAVQPAAEFHFVVRVASIYSRMGCDYLALMVLRSWRFETSEHVPGVDSAAPDLFLDFKMDSFGAQTAAPATFVEPDMSSFSFGF
ncbi:hypothetical protein METBISCDRAFT_12657 [Metschnikowia bicuspidata]|uniref:RAVE complex protein Rav1 C-terminal domain-containing protein n=1 Tax=Metschnikowia bicuspidata TaxID=27322 RepID=A0A4V1J3J1_9ASCO|nr:hypothetical protein METBISCDRAFT_12657 [Metschnikowia bicuspidata]